MHSLSAVLASFSISGEQTTQTSKAMLPNTTVENYYFLWYVCVTVISDKNETAEKETEYSMLLE